MERAIAVTRLNQRPTYRWELKLALLPVQAAQVSAINHRLLRGFLHQS